MLLLSHVQSQENEAKAQQQRKQCNCVAIRSRESLGTSAELQQDLHDLREQTSTLSRVL